MATWPSSLPLPLVDGYGVQIGDPTVRSDMDMGAARVRRRYRSVPDAATLKFLFNASQMADFREFWSGDANQGASWFYLSINTGLTQASSSYEVRATSMPKEEFIGNGLWSVSFSVEVRYA